MKWTKSCLLPVLFLSLTGLSPAAAPGGERDAKERWVTTWATAQSLMPMSFGPRGGGRPGPPPAARPASEGSTQAPAQPPAQAPAPQSQARPPQGRGPSPFSVPALNNQTVRMIVRTSIGGKRIRVSLSNMLNSEPVQLGAAHVALHKSGGAIAEGSDRVLTFGGKPALLLLPGVLTVSDPVDLDVAALTDLAVSLYFPGETGPTTSHMVGLRTAYISAGDTTASATPPEPTTMSSYVWLSSVEVVAPASAYTVVALGDSITDGYSSTRDAERAWPALLAARLQANKATRNVAVVNQGISGNQVLRDGAGLSALARLDRDVLSRPGVKWVILLEGINDINIRGRSEGPNALTAEEIIWGYRQIIARCHAHGIRVIGATIMAEEGVPTASERGEGIRQAVNEWIRAKGNFDAVVDFDAVTRDPQRPVRLKAAFDPGDHIHPNDAGNQAMADAFDLKLFAN